MAIEKWLEEDAEAKGPEAEVQYPQVKQSLVSTIVVLGCRNSSL